MAERLNFYEAGASGLYAAHPLPHYPLHDDDSYLLLPNRYVRCLTVEDRDMAVKLDNEVFAAIGGAGISGVEADALLPRDEDDRPYGFALGAFPTPHSQEIIGLSWIATYPFRASGLQSERLERSGSIEYWASMDPGHALLHGFAVASGFRGEQLGRRLIVQSIAMLKRYFSPFSRCRPADVRHILKASAAPDNWPSLVVLTQLGFDGVGWDSYHFPCSTVEERNDQRGARILLEKSLNRIQERPLCYTPDMIESHNVTTRPLPSPDDTGRTGRKLRQGIESQLYRNRLVGVHRTKDTEGGLMKADALFDSNVY